MNVVDFHKNEAHYNCLADVGCFPVAFVPI